MRMPEPCGWGEGALFGNYRPKKISRWQQGIENFLFFRAGQAQAHFYLIQPFIMKIRIGHIRWQNKPCAFKMLQDTA